MRSEKKEEFYLSTVCCVVVCDKYYINLEHSTICVDVDSTDHHIIVHCKRQFSSNIEVYIEHQCLCIIDAITTHIQKKGNKNSTTKKIEQNKRINKN